jgi:two-component system cell cycle sensor histidine kinase/response regulator CckA
MKNECLHLQIVEDEAAHVEALRRAFDQAGVKTDIHAAGTLREYRELIAAHPPDLALVDLNLPDGRATEILTHPAADAPFPILVMTAFGNQQVVVEVMKAGALDYVVKSPETFAAMPKTVERALREWRLLQQQKRAEETLRTSELRHRLLAEIVNAFAYSYFIRPDRSREQEWRMETLAVTGYTERELVERGGFGAIIHPDDRAQHWAVFERVIDGQDEVMDFRIIAKNGEVRWIRAFNRPVWSEAEHRMVSVQGVCQEITAHKRAEVALLESQALYFSLADQLPAGVFRKDLAGRYVFASPWFCRFKGMKAEGFLGKTDQEVAGGETAKRDAAGRAIKYSAAGEDHHQLIMRTGKPIDLVEEYPTAEGGKQFVRVIKIPVIAPDGKIIGTQGILFDITESRQAEESQARLAMAVEHAAETIVITDNDGTILYANPAFEKTSGYTRAEALGQNPRLLKSGKQDAEFYRRMWAMLTAGQVWSGDMINKRKDGTFYEEDVNISPVRDAAGKIVNYVAVKRDITEQKKLEAQLRRTQRLESIGTLAGGIAHDLNNALAPIMMSAELLRADFPATASGLLEIIQTSAKRGADMVKQLLTFAKGIEGERLLLQPRHLLKEMEKLIQNTFLKEIELRTHYPKDLWTILGDATQLHQVLLNLCVNARDAMPGGGTLTLEGENQELDAVYASTVLEAKPGRYVVWRVKDTGTGIPPEVLDHIFDPFFTTKGPDKGTGLGLSTTLGIVKSHGGFIRVYSTPGQGSTFAVYLPACGADASGTALLTKADTAFRGHGETILVVDDEADVRNMLRAILTKFNFKVLTADDGVAALIQVAEQQTELRAVITDLNMPNMDGLSFVRVLKGRLPGVGIIVASGRMEEREENEFKQLGVHAVLQKPFTQAQLVEALKTVFQK